MRDCWSLTSCFSWTLGSLSKCGQLKSSIGITLIDVLQNWLNWFHFLFLEGGLLIILIDYMIFLSPFLGVTRMSMSTTTAQLHSTKPQLRFCTDLNPACSMSEIHDGEDLWQWSQLEIRLNPFCWSTIPQKQFIIIINSFFPHTARLWISLPIECFPLTYNLNDFKSRISRHLLTVGLSKRDFLYALIFLCFFFL